MKNVIAMLTALVLVSGSAFGSIATEDFQSYTDGTWVESEANSGGWTFEGGTLASVRSIGTAFGRSGKGTKFSDPGNNNFATVWGGANGPTGRIEPGAGSMTLFINVQSNNSFAAVQWRKENNNFLAGFSFRSTGGPTGDLWWEDVSGWDFGFGTYTLGQWNRIDAQFNLPNNQMRVRYNLGTWTSFDGFSGGRTASTVSTVFSGRQSEFYIDDVSIPEIPVPEPASLALTGIGVLLLGFRNRKQSNDA